MSRKKLLAIKIAGFVGASVFVAAVVLMLPGYGDWQKRDDAHAAPGPWSVAGEYRTAARATFARHGRRAPGVIGEYRRALAAGMPVSAFVWVCNDGRPSDGGRYIFICNWRNRLSGPARAEYARRCQKRAEQEWTLFEADHTSCLPALALMGFLTTAYNVADAPLHRQAIARRFHGFRLWARQLQASRMREQWGITRPIVADYALLDWGRLAAGEAAAAVVPDPLARPQPGTR